jgi:hypothetical protein
MLEKGPIPSLAYNGRVRDEISMIIDTATSADAVIGLGGISLIARVETRPDGEDCKRYLFGMSWTPELEVRLHTTYRFVDITCESLRRGDIAEYWIDGTVKHVGRIAPDGDVISKWGKGGHVYKHPLFMIPNKYGNTVTFLRPVLL